MDLPVTSDAVPVGGDVVMVLTLRDGGRVEIWRREGCTGAELAMMLRQVADSFEIGDVRRVE